MRVRQLVGLVTMIIGLLTMVLARPVMAAPGGEPGTPPGNNGTVKIADSLVDDLPDNEPHVQCNFVVKFYNYEANVLAGLVFEVQPPTGTGVILTDVHFLDNDDAGGANEEGLDGAFVYSLDSLLAGFTPQPNQGWHVKLTIHAEGSQGNDTKHKTFWVDPCPPPTTTVPSTTSPSTTLATTTTATTTTATTLPTTTVATTLPTTTTSSPPTTLATTTTATTMPTTTTTGPCPPTLQDFTYNPTTTHPTYPTTTVVVTNPQTVPTTIATTTTATTMPTTTTTVCPTTTTQPGGTPTLFAVGTFAFCAANGQPQISITFGFRPELNGQTGTLFFTDGTSMPLVFASGSVTTVPYPASHATPLGLLYVLNGEFATAVVTLPANCPPATTTTTAGGTTTTVPGGGTTTTTAGGTTTTVPGGTTTVPGGGGTTTTVTTCPTCVTVPTNPGTSGTTSPPGTSGTTLATTVATTAPTTTHTSTTLATTPPKGVVPPAQAPPTTLPVTGSDPSLAIAIGLGLFLGGGVLAYTGRRRGLA